MINQQLLEYIKNQLEIGTTREEIERSLISSGGWTKSDVDEAFAGIIPPRVEMPIQNIPVEPYFNKPIEPYIQTSQVLTDNNLYSQQNIGALIQAESSGNILKSSVDLFKESLLVYKNKFGSFAVSLIPFILITILFPLATSISSDYIVFTFPVFIIVSFVLSSLSLSSILFVMANRERKLTFSEIINGGFNKMFSTLWVMMVSSFIILGGSSLFFIPGLIFSIWFSLSLVVLFGENRKGLDALLMSKEYVSGYWGSVAWRLFAFGLMMVVLSFIVFVPIFFMGRLFGFDTDFLGSLFDIFIIPISFIYSYLLYENIKRLKSGVVLQTGNKNPFIIVAIIGGIFIPLLFIGSITFGLFSLLKNADVKVETFSNINIDTSDGGIKSCGTDMDCFIASAGNCELATLTYKYSLNLDLFGIKENIETAVDIQGKDEISGKCKFGIKYNKITAEFPVDTPKEIIDQNNATFKLYEGRNGICKYESTRLVSILTNWKANNSDLSASCTDGTCDQRGDFKDAECTGTYFEPISQAELMKIYSTPANTITNTTTDTNSLFGSPVEIADWKTYIYKNYQFSYPKEWMFEITSNPERKSDGANFYFSGVNVGNLTCPIREIGYEGTNKETFNKQILLDYGPTYNISLDNFKDEDRAVAHDFSLIYINYANYQQSCEIGISAGKYYDSLTAKKIFNSIKITTVND